MPIHHIFHREHELIWQVVEAAVALWWPAYVFVTAIIGLCAVTHLVQMRRVTR